MVLPGGDELDRYLQERAGYGASTAGGYTERRFEAMGVDAVARIGFPYRGAENTLKVIIDSPKSTNWSGAGVEGALLNGALADLAILPRMREIDQTLTYSVAPGVALLLNDSRTALGRVYSVAQEMGKGNDIYESELNGYRAADAYHHSLSEERIALQEELGGADPADVRTVVTKLNKLEVALMESGTDVGARSAGLEDNLKTAALANEAWTELQACKGNPEKTKQTLARIRDKRQKVLRVEQAVTGLNEAARFLPALVSMQTDLGGIVKTFQGQDPNVATHMLRFLSLSPEINQATTVALREMLKLCYPKTDASGNLVSDSKITTESRADGGGVIDKSLTATKYTPADRDRFFEVWENVVVNDLEEKGVGNALRLAEDSVSFGCFMMEVFTLGQTAYQRDRETGRIIDAAHGGIDSGNGGSGSMYDQGGVDTADKAHQLQDRKGAEAAKGRIAPRPTVIKGLSQELLFSIFQYTEAKNGNGALNTSVLEALTSGREDYTVADFVENMSAGGHFTYMLYAFRACQISDKMDQLVNGRISALKELGGGPEKLVEEMIDGLQGLAKAFQTIPFGRGAVKPWMANSESAAISGPAKELKTMEINRNIINLLADFYRGAVAGTPGAGGYEDNPGWRGIIDLLPVKIYERLCVYTNLLTPQQFHLAIELAKDRSNGNTGGVLTEQLVYESNSPQSAALKDILTQSASTSDESLINVVKVLGVDGTAENIEGLEKALGVVINKSASSAESKSTFVSKTMKEPAKRKNPALRKSIRKA